LGWRKACFGCLVAWLLMQTLSVCVHGMGAVNRKNEREHR
jgi:hypothetical protein